MTCEQQLDRALQYFTDEEHKYSYEILDGNGSVMFSAPHAVLQTRNGASKAAERYTGILCKLLNESYKFPVIYKTRHLDDDANYDPVSDYRTSLCRYVKRQQIRYIIDLHQLIDTRDMDVCIGTGNGRNLLGSQELVEIAKSCFAAHGIRRITIDEPFAADNPNTVCATVASCCEVPAVQIELNSRLLTLGSSYYRLTDVLLSLHDFAVALNQLR